FRSEYALHAGPSQASGVRHLQRAEGVPFPDGRGSVGEFSILVESLFSMPSEFCECGSTQKFKVVPPEIRAVGAQADQPSRQRLGIFCGQYVPSVDRHVDRAAALRHSKPIRYALAAAVGELLLEQTEPRIAPDAIPRFRRAIRITAA